MSDELDRLLRDTLESEAQTYEPRGDGLSRIRSRVTARRARLGWLVPSLAAGALAAVVAGAVAIPVLLPDRDAPGPGPAGSGSASAPSSQGPPSSVATPRTPAAGAASLPDFPTLWPYQSRTAAAAGEPAEVAGRRPYLTDARATAVHFIHDYLGYPNRFEAIRTQPLEAGVGVVLGARNPNNQLYEVCTIYLVRVARGDKVPYVVVRADAPRLRLGAVSRVGPGVIAVSGTVGGIHEAVQVRVLTGAGGEVAMGQDGAVGPTAPWQLQLGTASQPVAPGRYAVVVRTLSDADGQLSELAVRPYDQR